MPGFTDTDLLAGSIDNIMKKTGRSREQAVAELRKHNPQGRLVSAAEVADTVLWLCGEGAGAITGQAIAVAGGAKSIPFQAMFMLFGPSKDGIAFRASTNNGASFASTKMLSSSGDSPQVSSIGEAVRVVWDDNYQKGNQRCFSGQAAMRGFYFGSIKNLSNNDGDSFVPMVISSGNNVYVAWLDNTPGNWETFFKKGVDLKEKLKSISVTWLPFSYSNLFLICALYQNSLFPAILVF